MASICNDERASFGVTSRHERKTLRLSGLAGTGELFATRGARLLAGLGFTACRRVVDATRCSAGVGACRARVGHRRRSRVLAERNADLRGHRAHGAIIGLRRSAVAQFSGCQRPRRGLGRARCRGNRGRTRDAGLCHRRRQRQRQRERGRDGQKNEFQGRSFDEGQRGAANPSRICRRQTPQCRTACRCEIGAHRPRLVTQSRLRSAPRRVRAPRGGAFRPPA